MCIVTKDLYFLLYIYIYIFFLYYCYSAQLFLTLIINQCVTMISEESWDTEYWSNG